MAAALALLLAEMADFHSKRSVPITSEEFFDSLYKISGDPWGFASNSYELDRYRAVLKALPTETFVRGFEPGCSIGVLTEALGQSCTELEAMDLSAIAVATAQQRCAHLTNVRIFQGALPEDLPDGEFDLVIFSEIGYYFERAALRSLVDRLSQVLVPGGTLLACHWLGYSPDHHLSGDAVHEVVGEMPNLVCSLEERHAGFRLQRWERV